MSNAILTASRPIVSDRIFGKQDETAVGTIVDRAKEVRRDWSPKERVARKIEAQLAQTFLAAFINLDHAWERSNRSSEKLVG